MPEFPFLEIIEDIDNVRMSKRAKNWDFLSANRKSRSEFHSFQSKSTILPSNAFDEIDFGRVSCADFGNDFVLLGGEKSFKALRERGKGHCNGRFVSSRPKRTFVGKLFRNLGEERGMGNWKRFGDGERELGLNEVGKGYLG
jgi:hypothetical protein